jgi:hypothetical protein
MKLVKEHINEFEQGRDPYKTMGLGSYKEGDKVKALYNLGFNHDENEWQANLKKRRFHDQNGVEKDLIYTIEIESPDSRWEFCINPWGMNTEDLNKFFKRV